MSDFYDTDYEISKRKSYMKHMTPDQLDYEMCYGSISVPEPAVCPGLCQIDKCPRAAVIKTIYRSDPCEYCSLSLDKKFRKIIKSEVNNMNYDEWEDMIDNNDDNKSDRISMEQMQKQQPYKNPYATCTPVSSPTGNPYATADNKPKEEVNSNNSKKYTIEETRLLEKRFSDFINETDDNKIKFEIKRRKNELKHMRGAELFLHRNFDLLIIPNPEICKGPKLCPKLRLISEAYQLDVNPCITCSHNGNYNSSSRKEGDLT